jgi:hypothetical protein
LIETNEVTGVEQLWYDDILVAESDRC